MGRSVVGLLQHRCLTRAVGCLFYIFLAGLNIADNLSFARVERF